LPKNFKKGKAIQLASALSGFLGKTLPLKSRDLSSLSRKNPLDVQLSRSLLATQNSILEKLCLPSYLHYAYLSLEEIKSEDASSSSSFRWLDDPFSLLEFELAMTRILLLKRSRLEFFF